MGRCGAAGYGTRADLAREDCGASCGNVSGVGHFFLFLGRTFLQLSWGFGLFSRNRMGSASLSHHPVFAYHSGSVIVPMVLMTLTRGLREQFDRHRAIARWTFPLWLYVSVTGVIVYLCCTGSLCRGWRLPRLTRTAAGDAASRVSTGELGANRLPPAPADSSHFLVRATPPTGRPFLL